MFDPLWLLLLLPVAAASGWYAAKFEQRGQSRQHLGLPQAYIEGLNFLLNEQPDKAIEVFIKALEVDPETVETHLAIGNLFRRRGEIERATRIHQNLIARPHLDKGQRFQALFELAQDYHKAGLLDRAERLFLELASAHHYGEPALRGLLDIYQQEKEWDKAISTCRKLGRVIGMSVDHQVAQFYCEQAEQFEASGDYEQADRLAQRALGADRACVRATMMLGKSALRDGDHAGAIRIWRKIEMQDPQYLEEVIDWIVSSFYSIGDEQGLYDFLMTAAKHHGSMKLVLALADVIERRDGNKAAQQFVLNWLREHPTAGGLQKLIDLKLVETDDSKGRGDLQILKGIIGGLISQHAGYACMRCGFRAKALHWQCPSCRRWSTIKPALLNSDDRSAA